MNPGRLIHMNTRKNARSKRGSTIVVVMLITVALTIVFGALLATMMTDKKIDRSMALANEARNAAEGSVEVAVAEIVRRADSYSSLTANSLADYTLPTDAATFLSGGNVVQASIAFKVGQLSPLPPKPVSIDPSDPFNEPDSDKGKPVILRHAYVYGKAAARDPSSGRVIHNYVSNLVQVREQTWLNYAIFYNLDMEMHSGSLMTVDGPVHTNERAYLTAGAGQRLDFLGSFTTAKQVLRTYKYGGTVTHTGSVNFTTKANPNSGDLLSMSTSQSSTMSGFKTFAENRWLGFVQDVSFSVPTFNPPGLLPYQPDDHTTSSTNEMLNAAYAMIEPQLSDISNDNPSLGLLSGYKGDATEDQKFSALAGLTIRVKPRASWSGTPGTPTDTNPGFELVYYVGSTNSNRPVNRANLPRRSASKEPIAYTVDLTKMNPTLLEKLHKAIHLVPFNEVSSGTAGNRQLTGVDVDPGSGTATRYGIYDRRQGYQGSSSNNGLLGAHNTIQVDMAKFNEFINAPESEWVDTSDSSKKVYDPAASYSGVVYVQIPIIPDSDSAVSARKSTDKIRPAVRPTTSSAGYAVVLRNAGVLPQLPSNLSLRDDGLTFATNAPVYIMGHYNADGSSSTGSSTAPDVSSGGTEIPALIAADAVTLLSASYSDTTMSNSALSTLNNASFTEVATGVLAGIVPTRLNTSGVGTNDQWAGGVHNFVRFLENWSGDTYRSRGSVVCLFENEVSLRPWYQGDYTYWYNFPTRDVGYHVYFAGGRFPPGLPVLRTVRRIGVDDITAAQYDAGPPTPPAAAN